MPQPVLSTKLAGQDIALVERTSLSLEVMPRSFGELREFAQIMSESDWLPAHFKGKANNCLLVCLQAYRWGMDPVAVAQQTYFAKPGQPAYMSQLIHALVLARAPLIGRLKIKFSGEWPKRVCTVSGKLQGDDEPQVYEIHAETIKTRNSPLWVSDPDQQLAYFATRGWARRFVPEVLMGIYAPDEMQDVTHSVVDSAPAERPETPTSKLDAFEEAIVGQRSFYRGAELAEPLGPLPEPPPAHQIQMPPEPPAKPIQEPPPPEAPEPEEEPEAPQEPPEEQGDALDQLLQDQQDLWGKWGSPNEYARQLAEILNAKRKEGSAAFEETLRVNKRYIDSLPPEVKTKLDDFIIANRERLRQRPQP